MASPRVSALRLAPLAVVMVACGLDESGILPDDASTPDVLSDVVVSDVVVSDVVNDVPTDTLPNPCTTLDVSACLDAGVPDGWVPVAIATSAATCPADYDTQAYIHNAQLEAGACACGCTGNGSYTCAGAVQYGANNCGNCSSGISQCGSTSTFDAGDSPGCFTNTLGGPDIAFGSVPTAAVAVGCDAGVTGSQGYTADPVTACVPKCTADFCNVSGFKRCVVSATATTCPSPFVFEDTVGSSATVTCAGCSCTMTPSGACSASITYYTGANCQTQKGTATPPSCSPTGASNIPSFQYTPTVPTAQCSASAAGSGGVTLTSPLTVCCLP